MFGERLGVEVDSDTTVEGSGWKAPLVEVVGGRAHGRRGNYLRRKNSRARSEGLGCVQIE